jgi:hypothetical protein
MGMALGLGRMQCIHPSVLCFASGRGRRRPLAALLQYSPVLCFAGCSTLNAYDSETKRFGILFFFFRKIRMNSDKFYNVVIESPAA